MRHPFSRQFYLAKPVVALGLSVAIATLGCSKPRPDAEPSPRASVEPQREQPTPSETVLVSSDGVSQLTLPAGWEAQNQLHDAAELQAANSDRELYIIVLSESKATLKEEEPEIDWSLETHSETTRTLLEDRLKAAGDVELGEPTQLTVGDYPALQYEMRGTLGDLDVVYLHTTVETPTRFHQVLAWTVTDKLEENQAEIERVIQSFQEVSAAEPSPNATTSPAAEDATSPTEASPNQAQ